MISCCHTWLRILQCTYLTKLTTEPTTSKCSTPGEDNCRPIFGRGTCRNSMKPHQRRFSQGSLLVFASAQSSSEIVSRGDGVGLFLFSLQVVGALYQANDSHIQGKTPQHSSCSIHGWFRRPFGADAVDRSRCYCFRLVN